MVVAAVVVEVTMGVVGAMGEEVEEGVVIALNVGSLVIGPENVLPVVGEVVVGAVIILAAEVLTDMVAAVAIATQEVAVIGMVAVVVAVAVTVAVTAVTGMQVLIVTVVVIAMGAQVGDLVVMVEVVVEVVGVTAIAVEGHPDMTVAITATDQVHMIAQMVLMVADDLHMKIAIEHQSVVFGNCGFGAAAAYLRLEFPGAVQTDTFLLESHSLSAGGGWVTVSWNSCLCTVLCDT